MKKKAFYFFAEKLLILFIVSFTWSDELISCPFSFQHYDIKQHNIDRDLDIQRYIIDRDLDNGINR